MQWVVPCVGAPHCNNEQLSYVEHTRDGTVATMERYGSNGGKTTHHSIRDSILPWFETKSAGLSSYNIRGHTSYPYRHL